MEPSSSAALTLLMRCPIELIPWTRCKAAGSVNALGGNALTDAGERAFDATDRQKGLVVGLRRIGPAWRQLMCITRSRNDWLWSEGFSLGASAIART